MSQQTQTDVTKCIVSVSKATKTSSSALFVQIACFHFYTFHACHWERHGKNSLQTVSSCVPSLMHVFVKYLFHPCKFAKDLPRLEIRIWHECEYE